MGRAPSGIVPAAGSGRIRRGKNPRLARGRGEPGRERETVKIRDCQGPSRIFGGKRANFVFFEFFVFFFVFSRLFQIFESASDGRPSGTFVVPGRGNFPKTVRGGRPPGNVRARGGRGRRKTVKKSPGFNLKQTGRRTQRKKTEKGTATGKNPIGRLPEKFQGENQKGPAGKRRTENPDRKPGPESPERRGAGPQPGT